MQTNIFSHKIIVALVTIMLMLVTLTMDDNATTGMASLLFLIQYGTILIGISGSKSLKFLVLSPSFLCISYTSLNLILGSAVYYFGFVMDASNYNKYVNWEFARFSTLYFLACNCVAFFCCQFYSNKYHSLPCRIALPIQKSKAIMVILFSLSVIFVLVPIKLDLSVVGGSGNVTFVFQSVCAISLFYCSHRYFHKFRFIVYFCIISLMSALYFNSKRQAIALILSIIFIEVFFAEQIKVKIKHFLGCLFVMCIVTALIIAMSIARGYGNYGTNDSIIESIRYIPDYATRPDTAMILASNFEVGYSFYTSYQSLEYVFSGMQELAYGNTLYKLLFVPFPRSFIGEKPSSCIEEYTSRHDPAFRRSGGSYPVPFYSEMFWNFHFFGVFAVAILLLLFDHLYFKFLSAVHTNGFDFLGFGILLSYQFLLFFFRGSGLDLFAVYSALALLSAYMAKSTLKCLNLGRI